MKLIVARFEDICTVCCGKIKPGDIIKWEKKNSHHAECDTGALGRWMKSGK